MERIRVKDRDLPGDILNYISDLELANKDLTINHNSLKLEFVSLKEKSTAIEINNNTLETKTVLQKEQIEELQNKL